MSLHPRLIGLAAASLLLAACGAGDERAECVNPASAATFDTAMGLRFAGRQVLISANDEVSFFVDTVDHVMLVHARRYTGDISEWVTMSMAEFTGARDYQARGSLGPSGVAFVSYVCQQSELPWGAEMVDYRPIGVEGDTLRITSFDPVTGEVSGNFRFTAARVNGQGAVLPGEGEFQVTEGRFHTFATLGRLGPAARR